MTIKDYYDTFKDEVCHNIDAALTDTYPVYPSIAKNLSFVEDYGQWISAIDNRPETIIYKNAIRAIRKHSAICSWDCTNQPLWDFAIFLNVR